jgi:hypothetical protein
MSFVVGVPELKIMSFWSSFLQYGTYETLPAAWWPFILYGLHNIKNTDSSKSTSRIILLFDTFNTQ